MQFSSPLYTLNPQYSPFKSPDYTGMRDAFSTQPLRSFNDLTSNQLYDVPSNITQQLPSTDTLSNSIQDSVLKPAQVSTTPIPQSVGDTVTATNIHPTILQKFRASTFGRNFGLWNTGLNIANTAFTNLFGEKNTYSGEKGDITRGMDSTYDQIQNSLSQAGPGGQLASLVMGANKLLGSFTNTIGGGTDGMTTTDAILDSSLSQLTGVGLVAGLINGFGGKKANSFTKDNLVWEDMGSSYSGSNNLADNALKKSGKKYGLFSSGSRHAANRQIAEAKRQQEIVSDIQDEANNRFDIASSTSAINGLRRKLNLQGGYDISGIRVGKNGMSLNRLNRTKSIIQKMQVSLKFQNGGTIQNKPTEIQLVNPIDIPEFQQGGSMNVIPDGALHARKHNMDMDGITKKGIPVVSEKDNGDIEQQAEIEKEEIIFRLEVTQKLEELEKKFYDENSSKKEKDEYALEAGKLLTNEILNNTVDNTNNLL